jgi:hypothetical protein
MTALFIILIILCIVIILKKKIEGADNTGKSKKGFIPESVQILGSMYKAGELKTNKIETNKIEIGDKYLLQDNPSSNNNWLLLGTKDGKYGDLGLDTHNVWVNNKLTVRGDARIDGKIDAIKAGTLVVDGYTKLNLEQRDGDYIWASDRWDWQEGDSAYDSNEGRIHATCPKNQYMCGVTTKHWYGSEKNDSAINGLAIRCCKFGS